MFSKQHFDFEPIFESEEEKTIFECLIDIQELRQTIKTVKEEIENGQGKLNQEERDNLKWQLLNRKRDLQISYLTISENLKGWKMSFSHHLKDYKKSLPK